MPIFRSPDHSGLGGLLEQRQNSEVRELASSQNIALVSVISSADQDSNFGARFGDMYPADHRWNYCDRWFPFLTKRNGRAEYAALSSSHYRDQKPGKARIGVNSLSDHRTRSDVLSKPPS